MRILHGTALLGGLALITACGSHQGLTVPTAATPTVQGTLRDYQTQAPLARTTILFTTDIQSSGGYRTVTDGNGHYSMPQPPRRISGYFIVVNGVGVGLGCLTGSNYRGDLLIDTGTCISRYGQVLDANTLKPIAGATLSGGPSATTSGSDGWYRVDWGCPASGVIGVTTTALNVALAGYAPIQWIVGRGVSHVQRVDFLLEPQ